MKAANQEAHYFLNKLKGKQFEYPVYFDVEDESKGVYTIVVRDNNTTVEMVTYKVDINKNIVTEQ